MWSFVDQIRFGQNGGEKEIAASFGMDQHRVLADPTQACSVCEMAFQERRRVDDDSAPAVWEQFAKSIDDTSKGFANPVVIVDRSGGIRGYGPSTGFPQCIGGGSQRIPG
jgi:hypothetical protein